MALVDNGSIEINGRTVECVSWSIKGGPAKEGKYGVGARFLGRVTKPADFEIEVELLQMKGKPPIDFDRLVDGFTMTRNYVGGARHQFVDCSVSSSSEEEADADGNFTRKVMILASGKLEQ